RWPCTGGSASTAPRALRREADPPSPCSSWNCPVPSRPRENDPQAYQTIITTGPGRSVKVFFPGVVVPQQPGPTPLRYFSCTTHQQLIMHVLVFQTEHLVRSPCQDEYQWTLSSLYPIRPPS